MKVRANKTACFLLSFFIPFVIVFLAYIALHIAPFGEHTLIISDAKGLYTSDLMFITRVLRGQEDLLYSFKPALGMNLMGSNSGLWNPANAIALLFDITNLPVMYSLLMAIDIAMCGLTMFLFLSNVYGSKGRNLIFSTIYAMMGFNVAYCYHYNFILSPELLPLIALGIHRILKGKKPWLYIISLGYAIFASFYFGYMLCIASVVLFLFWYVRDRVAFGERKCKIWVYYICGSLIAGLLPALVWIPTLLSFMGGRLDQNTILDFTFVENMSLADVCAKFFIGANNLSEQVNGQPNIFIGSLALFLNFAFFIDRRNSRRTKIIYAVPLAFYFITFYIKAFAMVMQGFSVTNWFNYRYSFVFSFLMILIAFEEFGSLRSMEAGDFRKTCGVFALFVVLVFGQRYSYVTGGGMLLGVVLLSVCLGIIWWNRVDPKRAPANILTILLVLICSMESYANYVICTGSLKDWEVKASDYQEDLFKGSIIADAVQRSDTSLYRMENEHSTNGIAANDPRLFGYNGLIYFGSCESNFVFQGLSKLGMSWWGNRMWYSEGKPSVFDSLLGLKYVISERDLSTEKGYEQLINLEGHKIYRNPNALPIAMLAAPDEMESTLSLNPFENHNALWKSITGGSSNVFDIQQNIQFTYHAGNDGKTVEYDDAKAYSTSLSVKAMSSSESESENSLTTSESDSIAVRDIDAIRQSYHIECSFLAEHDGSVYAYNGLAVDENNGFAGEAMYYLGTYQSGEMITDYIPLSGPVTNDALNMVCAEYSVAYVNQRVLADYSTELINNSGTIEKSKDSLLLGNVVAKDDARLFFTIPYDEGWTLTVDGQKTPLTKTADLFMSANIDSGEHSYELRFFPKGMRIGIYISCCATVLLLLLIFYNILDRKRLKHIVVSEEA